MIYVNRKGEFSLFLNIDGISYVLWAVGCRFVIALTMILEPASDHILHSISEEGISNRRMQNVEYS